MRYAKTGDAAWMGAFKRWTKVFALTFAMGVVTGITMSFQFGTNWPGYMLKVGKVLEMKDRLLGGNKPADAA